MGTGEIWTVPILRVPDCHFLEVVNCSEGCRIGHLENVVWAWYGLNVRLTMPMANERIEERLNIKWRAMNQKLFLCFFSVLTTNTNELMVFATIQVDAV